jgi:hypothetical protein
MCMYIGSKPTWYSNTNIYIFGFSFDLHKLKNKTYDEKSTNKKMEDWVDSSTFDMYLSSLRYIE